MRLILSSRNPRESDYSTEAGQILYKADKSGNTITSLRKVQDNGNFVLYAQVEFHDFKSTRFRSGNNKGLSVDVYFRTEGWFKPKQVFRAADFREYYWKLDGRHLEMFRKGVNKQQVVRFLEGKHSFGGFITDGSASLEVDNSCLPILDEIIMTFVYSHKQRQNRQRNDAGINPARGALFTSGAGISAFGGGDTSAFGACDSSASGGGDTSAFGACDSSASGGGDTSASGGGNC